MASNDIKTYDEDTQPTQVPNIDDAAREEEDNQRYPHRPHNHAATLPFRTLYEDLFEPLLANQKPLPGKQISRRKVGPNSVNSTRPSEVRRNIIDRYISRWRKEVGNDFYPAMRLILPDKDRDRAMYGLKEKVLARYLIKILKIDKNSKDGYDLLNFKQASGKGSGNFPACAHDALKKRPFRTEPGTLTVDEVNAYLGELAKSAREEDQLPILENLYRQMNADEFKWLICIILRIMHIGSTEKTILSVWHPDADTMFNISSSLKRVCWELWNPSIRLRSENDQGVEVFACFQPQLANFQPKKLHTLLASMKITDEDREFWIEEKLDGERMQLHMANSVLDEDGKKCDVYKTFKFWSRKAKDYTYLYGSRFDDPNSALTRHLRNAFHEDVESIILDGEMITWDPLTDKMVPFGTLKTAALDQSANPYSNGPRPLYRVFDIMLLNGTDLTRYTLRDRRNALERVLRPVERRIEIIEYAIGHTLADVERALMKVVAEASEGLVVKNPRSRYRLNDRNDDWLKVKPEYMEEFGESLDCLVIGGYYGSGKRGGGLSSFLCGLRVDHEGRPTQKFLSFFKVGGGLTANDYANIRHHTENKWIKWDSKSPPTEYVELGGGVQYQREKPDVWIKPEDSVVIQAKAASVGTSDEFAANLTLRFPRFQKLRGDKDWQSALSLQEFYEVRATVETKREENEVERQMKAQHKKSNKRADLRKRPLQVVGYTQKSINEAALERGQSLSTGVFNGLTVYVMTESVEPERKTKLQLEELVKLHGGKIVQTADVKVKEDGTPADEVVCIGAKRTVKVASLIKRGVLPILKPSWLFDCVSQAQTDLLAGLAVMVLRPESSRHVFYTPDERREAYECEIDRYGDSYGRDTTVEELRECMSNMRDINDEDGADPGLRTVLVDVPGRIFERVVIFFAGDEGASRRIEQAKLTASFAGAIVVSELQDSVTHVVVDDERFARPELSILRGRLAQRRRLPRVVALTWITDCWAEKTRIDEERYAVV